MERILSAAQYDNISRFKAQAEGIHRHVRAGFVNDPDYPKRHAFFPDHQTVRTFFHGKHFADGIL